MAEREPRKSVVWFAILALVGIAAYLLWSQTARLLEEAGAPGPKAREASPAAASQAPAEVLAAARPPASAVPPRETGKCGYLLGGGTLRPAGVEGPGEERSLEVLVDLPERLEPGSTVLAIPHPAGPALRLAVARASQTPGDPSGFWMVGLETADAAWRNLEPTAPESQTGLRANVAVLFPVPEEASLVEPATIRNLPPEVARRTVELAVDLGREGTADLLVVRFSCSDRSQLRPWDSYCKETWQKIDSQWVKCSFWEPL